MKDVKDPALFQRAFSPGLQEFIEALCFLRMIESSDLPTCGEVSSDFKQKKKKIFHKKI